MSTATLEKTDEKRAEAIYDRVLADLPAELDLTYVHYDDRLSEQQIVSILGGSEPWEVASLDEWECDQRHHYAMQEITERTTEEERHLLEGNDWMDELRFAVQDRDRSEPYTQLMSQTPDLWFRYELPYEFFDDERVSLEWHAREICDVLGLSEIDNMKSIVDLLTNAGTGTLLYVLWRASIRDLWSLLDCSRRHPSPKDDFAFLVWRDPTLLLFNRLSGYGYESAVKGVVSTQFCSADLHLDMGQGSWSDWTCGGLTGDTPDAEFMKTGDSWTLMFG